MNGLTNEYIEKLSKLCINNFISVLPCDIFFKKELKCGQKYIVNLAKAREPIGHFVAICVEKDHFVYFDSYGLSCYNSFINAAFLKRPNFKIKYFEKDVQGLGEISFFCGFYCLCYLICKEMKLSNEQFASLFTDSFRDNEKTCIDIIKGYLTKMK